MVPTHPPPHPKRQLSPGVEWCPNVEPTWIFFAVVLSLSPISSSEGSRPFTAIVVELLRTEFRNVCTWTGNRITRDWVLMLKEGGALGRALSVGLIRVFKRFSPTAWAGCRGKYSEVYMRLKRPTKPKNAFYTLNKPFDKTPRGKTLAEKLPCAWARLVRTSKLQTLKSC